MKRDDAARDLIEEYLDHLRRGLRVRSGEAELILAEAEDHLRETEAAGIAVGMTEHEAQQAAISSFGSVGAVTRAHLARLARGTAALAQAAMAAWKLVSLLLVTGGVSGMTAILASGLGLWRPVQLFPAGSGHYIVESEHLSFNWLSGAWTETITSTSAEAPHRSLGRITWLAQPVLGWQTAVLLAVAGATMLIGYGLVRRRSPREPLARTFPAVAVSVFGAVGLAFLVLTPRFQFWAYDPRPVTAMCLAITLGYAVRLGQVLLRQR